MITIQRGRGIWKKFYVNRFLVAPPLFFWRKSHEKIKTQGSDEKVSECDTKLVNTGRKGG